MSYHDPNLATRAAADSHVHAAQGKFTAGSASYQKLVDRGSDALGEILGKMYVSIETILASTSADVQALILGAHHVKPSPAGASDFGPWIKVMTGSKKPNGKLKKSLVEDAKYPEWEANRSYERYAHVFEWLRENGVTEDHAAAIKAAGGATAIVNERKADIAAANGKSKKETASMQRSLLLSEGEAHGFDLPFELPEGAGEFYTVVCQAVDDAHVMLGVVRADAERDVDALAAAQFKTLNDAKVAREAREAAEAAVRAAADVRAADGARSRPHERGGAAPRRGAARHARDVEAPADEHAEVLAHGLRRGSRRAGAHRPRHR